MNWRVVKALVAKDLALFVRNRFFAVVSVLGVVAYVAIYFVMPSSVDETLEIGLYAPAMPPYFEQFEGEEGLSIATFDSEEALKDAVANGQYAAGVVLPQDFLERLAARTQVRIHAFFASDVPEELEGAVTALMRQVAFLLSGQMLPVELSTEILGPDLVGKQIPPRDRMLSLFAVFLIITETLGLASLISEEVETGTIQALLITPMTIPGLFAAKGLTGVSLAFVQAALFMAATRGLTHQPLLILVALLLGAILVTGIGFLLASLGKDLMSVMAWGIPAIVLLSVPSFGVMFPGTISDWAKVIPSYYVADTLHQAVNFGIGWVGLWGNLLALLGFDILFVAIGMKALRRKLG